MSATTTGKRIEPSTQGDLASAIRLNERRLRTDPRAVLEHEHPAIDTTQPRLAQDHSA